MSNFTKLDERTVREIRKRMGKASSCIIVVGMGCTENYIPTFTESDKVSSLQSRDLDELYEAWDSLLRSASNVEKIGFLKSYFDELNDSMSVANAYVVNNSPVNVIPERTNSRIKIVDLWGDVQSGVDVKTGKRVSVSHPLDRESVAPLFPDSELSQKKRQVSEVESSFNLDHIASVMIVGASGGCPVTESVFNNALVKKIPITVVNPDRDCYMHSLAHISLTCSAQEFFEKLKEGFAKYDHSY